MNCPTNCGAQLVMSERMGVEIDYCPTCRGVWLDRGELDKIIDKVEKEAEMQAAVRAQSQPQQAATQAPAPQQPGAPVIPQRIPQPQPQVFIVEDDDDYYKRHGYKKKRKGLLGELFDFD